MATGYSATLRHIQTGICALLARMLALSLVCTSFVVYGVWVRPCHILHSITHNIPSVVPHIMRSTHTQLWSFLYVRNNSVRFSCFFLLLIFSNVTYGCAEWVVSTSHTLTYVNMYQFENKHTSSIVCFDFAYIHDPIVIANQLPKCEGLIRNVVSEFRQFHVWPS